MTEKLYYIDSYIFNCESKILDIIVNERIAVILDRTCFFPEGGGQKSDVGFIGESFVYDVKEVNGLILHYIKDLGNLECGKTYNCAIDKEIRFLRMQAHTGEHILSGLAHKYFGIENVGFHMDADNIMTVDFNLPLTENQVSYLEIEANKAIFSNYPVRAEIYSSVSTIKFNYRSKIDIADEVRIVTIGDIDACACCAPHLNFTAEVGLLKILSCISHRGGIRLTVICGFTSFNDYCNKYKQILNISALICAPHNDTYSAVEQLVNQNKELKKSISDQKDRLFDYITDNAIDEKFIIKMLNDFTTDELRLLSNKLSNKAKYGVFLFTGNDSDGYTFCLNSDYICLCDFLSDMKKSINAFGGGKGNIIQGKILSDKQSIFNFFNEKRKQYENEKKETS